MQGLKWFRIDVNFDDKFELLCAEYGSKGFEVIVRLWQKIYASGYYLEWNDEVALLFARKYSMGGNVVSEIVKSAVYRGLFDKEKLDRFGILTSRGIQDWYFDSVDRRKSVEIVKDYLLVNVTQKLRNVDIIWKNVNKNEKNVNIFSIQTDKQTYHQPPYIPLQGGEGVEPNGQAVFFAKFPNVLIDNYSTELQGLTDEDWKEITKQFENSAWLRENIKTLSSLCRISKRIIAGEFAPFKKAKDEDTKEEEERRRRAAEFDKMFGA